MKKLLLLKILFVFPIFLMNIQNAFGQTLTCQTSCPQAGEVFSMRTSSPVLNSPGANQLWNFSSIAAISPETHLISYNIATSVPTATLYPQADLVRTGTGADAFLTVGNGGVREVYPITVSATINPMELPLPFAYGDIYTETVISTSVSGADTFVTSLQNSFAAHGSGTLILPSGTFQDVLAIKFKSTRSVTKNGSPYGYIYYNTSYYYYSQTISHPLLYTRQLSESGAGDYGPYTEFIDHVIVGIENEAEEDGSDIVVFPNPAGDLVNIRFAAITKGTVLLKNSLGQQLIAQNCGEGSFSLSLAGLPEGMYIISFVSDTYTINKKLVVSK